MERISIFIRTTKKTGKVKLRFRLIDGRLVQLYHTTEIEADVQDLSKFNPDGTVKGKVTIYNRQLKKEIDKHISAMRQAYYALCEQISAPHISGPMFEGEVSLILNPREKMKKREQKESMLARFQRYIDNGVKKDYFGPVRKRNYQLVLGSLERYLTIKHWKKISADEFTADMLEGFQAFLRDEYKYVDRYPKLFEHLNERRKPKAEREPNTIAMRMKMIQAFFNELVEKNEVPDTPFHKLGRKVKSRMMREEYDSPKFLRKDEFFKVLNTEVPTSLKEAKDAFLVQCAFGCRISDFITFGMEKIKVSEDGIPYVHYLPRKTIRTNTKKEEIETPIMLYALNIIKAYNFHFPILKYVSGERGYTAKIKQVLKHCGIDRDIAVYNEEKRDNDYVPLWEFGSSKLCRSTHVDMMSKVQINLYASGLHHAGSNAVHHYTENELQDRFALMCVAFGQPLYKVDKDLNIIE